MKASPARGTFSRVKFAARKRLLTHLNGTRPEKTPYLRPNRSSIERFRGCWTLGKVPIPHQSAKKPPILRLGGWHQTTAPIDQGGGLDLVHCRSVRQRRPRSGRCARALDRTCPGHHPCPRPALARRARERVRPVRRQSGDGRGARSRV